MSEWQTLDSAPKDGSEFLGYGDGGYGVCKWVDDLREREEFVRENRKGERIYKTVKENFGYWYWDNAGYLTHWMPLPKPPEASA